jgi:alpha-galactosidase/6-phospho-beta-glucosidase family protein
MYDASGIQAITVDHLPATYRSYMPSTVMNYAEVAVRAFASSPR